MKIIQIATGTYNYMQPSRYGDDTEMFSHCVYALGDDGVVYKYMNASKKWVPLLEKQLNYHNDK